MPSAGCGQNSLTGAQCNELDGRNEIGTMTDDIVCANKDECKCCDRPVSNVDDKIKVVRKPVVSVQTDNNLSTVCNDSTVKRVVDLSKFEHNAISDVTSEVNAPQVHVNVNATRKRCEPVRLKGKVEGVLVEFMCDTGAESTILSKQYLKRIPNELRQQFQDQAGAEMIMTNKESAPAYGPVLCTIECNGRKVLEPVYIADISDAALLGWDAQLALGAVYQIAGVDLVQTPMPRARRTAVMGVDVRRVTVAADCVVPPMSEMLVPIGWEKLSADRPMMVMGVSNPAHNGGLVVARTLVRGDKDSGVVRLMNVSTKERTVKAGNVIANIEVVEELSVDGQAGTTAERKLPEHLQTLYDKVVDEARLSTAAAEGFGNLLLRHQNVFAKDDNDLGRTDLVLHDIQTGDARPIRQPPRRLPLAQEGDCEKEVQAMLAKGVIEPGYSPWSSPVVLVRKKDGTLRFCVDYRRLNAVTEFDCYPLPRIDETLDHLSGAQWFTTLDLISGYWQVGMTSEARSKSAFCTRSGLYLWKVMPFGLCNAPSTFERLMERVLQGLQWHTCLVYIDDVVVFGKDEMQLLERMEEVFHRLKSAGLKVKPRKCCFFTRETTYLGHVISGEGVKVSPEKVAAIREWPVPQNVTELRSFMGTANYYRRFVASYSTIAAPLHDLTGKGTPYVWTAVCQEAFDKLKAELCSTPVLAFPVPGAMYVLDTDASDRGIGAVLSQLVPVQSEDSKEPKYEERVLAYASKTLSKHERNYCVTRREMLALVWSVRYFRPYLYGREFIARTDHASLQWLRSFKEPEGQVARWLQVLGEYQYSVTHREGQKHGNADGLSRQAYCAACTEPVVEEPVHVRVTSLRPEWTPQQLATWQEEDDELKSVIEAVRAGVRPTADEIKGWPSVTKRLMLDWERLVCVENVVYREWYTRSGQLEKYQLVTPKNLRPQIMSIAHDGVLGGHYAEKKTALKLRDLFYWPRLVTDVRDYCRSCLICQRRKPHPKRPRHPLQQDSVGEPMQKVTLDLLSFDQPSDSGYHNLLVIVDSLTKWAEAFPVEDTTAVTVAKVAVEEVFCRYGPPVQLHTDQGPQLTGEVFTEMCRLMGFNKTNTTPYRPESDGQTERMNRGLLELLSKAAADDPNNWDTKLPYVLSAYRSTPHATTGETPNRLMLGRETTVPLTLLAPPVPNLPARPPWIESLHENFAAAHMRVQEHIGKAQRVQKSYYDKRVKLQLYDEGQLVWLWKNRKAGRGPRKLNAERWEGPLEVKKRISGAVYLVGKCGEQRGRVVSVAHLAPYIQRREDLQVRPVAQQPMNKEENEFDEAEPEAVVDEQSGDVQEEQETIIEGRSDEEEQEANDTVPKTAPVRIRPQRAGRKPVWMADYVQGSSDDD
jgi:hypothetical protein